MTRKGKIVVLIISLLIESLLLAFLFFNCAIPLDTSSAVKGESSVEFSLIHLEIVAFKKLFLTAVFSSTLKSLEKCSIHCLGGIASTELGIKFPLRVFRCSQNCFGLFVKVSNFFVIFFPLPFFGLGCIFVLLPNFLVVVYDVYVFRIFL